MYTVQVHPSRCRHIRDLTTSREVASCLERVGLSPRTGQYLAVDWIEVKSIAADVRTVEISAQTTALSPHAAASIEHIQQ